MSYADSAREFLNNYVNELDDMRKHFGVCRFRDFAYNHEMIFSAGMTRIVLIGYDFVIKIDKPRDDVGSWAAFGNCYQEYNNYKKATKDGYEYLFAEITKIKVGHHFYYIMPRVDTNHTCEDDAWELDGLSEEESDYLSSNFMDLHELNYGFDDFGNLKIFDYAVTFEYYNNYMRRH